MTSKPSKARPGGSTRTMVIGVVVVVGIALAIAVATTGGGGDEPDAASAFGTPEVTGTALPPLQAGADPAVGATAPVVEAESVAGEAVQVGGEGSQIVAFLAHWCSHCQREVPVVVDWVEGGGLPEGLDLLAVATASDESQPNFPPQDWLAEEAWPTAIVLDDADSSVASAFGVGSFPFWVVLHDGEVVGRTSGELTMEQLSALADLALQPLG